MYCKTVLRFDADDDWMMQIGCQTRVECALFRFNVSPASCPEIFHLGLEQIECTVQSVFSLVMLLSRLTHSLHMFRAHVALWLYRDFLKILGSSILHFEDIWRLWTWHYEVLLLYAFLSVWDIVCKTNMLANNFIKLLGECMRQCQYGYFMKYEEKNASYCCFKHMNVNVFRLDYHSVGWLCLYWVMP